MADKEATNLKKHVLVTLILEVGLVDLPKPQFISVTIRFSTDRQLYIYTHTRRSGNILFFSQLTATSPSPTSL